MFKRVLAAGAVLLAAGGTAAVTSGAASAAPRTVSAVTHLSDRSDSGYGGNNWAVDTLSRTATITLQGADANTADCGALATSCYAYTGTVSDRGTAAGINGQTSPGAQGVPVANSPVAAVQGLATVSFDSSSNSPDAHLVPRFETGNSQSTSTWAEQFFPVGTTFGNENLPTWTWNYTDSRDCQSWTDAYNGSKAASGDITGADSCTTTVRYLGTQYLTQGRFAWLQVRGGTNSSDRQLHYSATGLPAGLSISRSGVISGTPRHTGTSYATVTVTDFGGVSAHETVKFVVSRPYHRR